MENHSDILKSDSKPTGIGLGERLQAARIKQGLSIEDIASRMHLNVQIVKSIEENNFNDITAPIFVKGYLRAYARIVSLDEEEMIEQYASYYSHEDPPIATTSNMAPELSVADVRIKWTTYLVILVLAALLGAWWWSKNHDEAMPISLESQGGSGSAVELDVGSAGEESSRRSSDASDSEGAMTATSPASSTQQQGAGSEAAVEAAPGLEPGIASVDEPAAADTNLPQAPVAQAVEPPPAPAAEIVDQTGAEPQPDSSAAASAGVTGDDLPVAPKPAVESAAEPAPEPAAEPAPEPVRLGAPVLVAPSGSDTLSLTVNADTWADIEDGNDFQMVYHLLRAGQTLELTGSAPFSVFLGNGPGVEIRLNGEPVDFSARIRSDNTTRLTLGR